ncbi:hypothetical protein LCGC14_1598520 [marine sediment metagenome]|uniref:Uncharacterized protein n=1 Tax=marine sediment metagenome TaxID=412755 RepID=A0A0F9LC17_9ZZZZ
MKNQYVADINDYNKYLLLAGFSRIYDVIDVCWMLTADDYGRDGTKTIYLFDESKRKDTLIYDYLKGLVISGAKDVSAIENGKIIPVRNYYHKIQEVPTPPDLPGLLFLDPDNGLEVKSIPLNSPKSERYVYYSDIKPIIKQGCDVLVYQHYPRVNRGEYHLYRTQEIKSRIGDVSVRHISMGMVDFILIHNLTDD